LAGSSACGVEDRFSRVAGMAEGLEVGGVPRVAFVLYGDHVVDVGREVEASGGLAVGLVGEVLGSEALPSGGVVDGEGCGSVGVSCSVEVSVVLGSDVVDRAGAGVVAGPAGAWSGEGVAGHGWNGRGCPHGARSTRGWLA
jgi:hypothetical protein